MLNLYRAVCALPPLDPEGLTCASGLHDVVYEVRFLKRRNEILRLTLDMGGCQIASFLGAGRVAFYRLPKHVVSLVAMLLGVPAKRLSPPDRLRLGDGQATENGLRLRLTIPRLTYPRDALVRVTIRLTNSATGSVDVTGNDAPECSFNSGVGVEVRTKTGRLVYPPAAEWEMTSCGKPVFPIKLLPGRSLVDHPLIVLRGPRLRAVVTVGKLGHPVTELKTPALHIQLTAADPPPMTFSTQGGPELTIGPVPWRHSTLYYVESGVCLQPGEGGGGSGTPTWEGLPVQPDGIYHFGMPCDANANWAFTGGALNHSVVSETVHTSAMAGALRLATAAKFTIAETPVVQPPASWIVEREVESGRAGHACCASGRGVGSAPATGTEDMLRSGT